MITKKVNYWDIVDRTSCHSKIVRTEEFSYETEDALFEAFYKKNNSLRYCNGSYYKFADNADQDKYMEWYKNLDKARSFNLFYGNGVVD